MNTCTYVLWQLLKVKRTALNVSKAPSFGRRHSLSNETFLYKLCTEILCPRKLYYFSSRFKAVILKQSTKLQGVVRLSLCRLRLFQAALFSVSGAHSLLWSMKSHAKLRKNHHHKFYAKHRIHPNELWKRKTETKMGTG